MHKSLRAEKRDRWELNLATTRIYQIFNYFKQPSCILLSSDRRKGGEGKKEKKKI